MSEIKNVEAFITVVDAGSFNKAADQLYTTSSSISKRVTALEATLKLELLQRSNHGVVLTEMGQQFYEAAKPFAEQWGELIEQFTDNTHVLRGSLRLGIPRWSCDRFINACATRFLALHPDVSIDVNVANLFGAPAEEKCDIVFSADESYGKAYSHLVRKKILTLTRGLYASPQFLANNPPIEKLSDISQYNGLARKQIGNTWELNGEWVTMKSRYKSDDADALLQAAVAGVGILYGSPFIMLNELQTQQLVPVLPNYRSEDYHFYAYYEKKRYPSKVMKAFIDYVLKECCDESN